MNDLGEDRANNIGEREKRDVGMTSFNFLSSSKLTIPAYINILDISRSFGSFIDKESSFKSQLHLIRGSPTYSLFIKPSSGALGKEYSVTSLEFMKPGEEKNSLYAEFEGPVMILVQFKHVEHFEYFQKILTEFIRLNHERNSPYRKFNENVKPIPAQICEYSVKKKKRPGVMKKLLSGAGGTGNSVGDREFYQINSVDWDGESFGHWLDHIYIQPISDQGSSVMSVREYLRKIGSCEVFLDYFVTDKGTTESILHEIRKFSEDRTKVHPKLISIFHDRYLIRSLRNECLSLKKRNGMFNINFALVLKKRIRQLHNLFEKGTIRLSDVVYNLKHERRYWWSVEDCRDHILSYLVFRKEFSEYVQDMEDLFFRKEREKFEPIIGVSWEEDDRQPLLIPSTEWEAFVEDFNEKNFGGGRKNWLQLFSYKVHLAVQQNQLRKKREDYLDIHFEFSQDVCDLEKKLLQSTNSKISLVSRIEKLEQKVSVLKKKQQQGENRVLNKLSQVLEMQKKKLEEVERGRAETMNLITSKKGDEIQVFTQHDEKMLVLDNDIYRMTPEAMGGDVHERDSFMESKDRRDKITEYLSEKISMIGMNNNNNQEEESEGEETTEERGMKEFTVKLIFSILRGHVPKKWQRKLVSSLDKFWKPQFSQWGFVHASVQISNVGFHWLSNGLVMISNLSVGRQYKDLVAFDCNCPLVINVDTIYDRITKLAETVVSTNINKEYTLLNYGSRIEKLNCHEFANRMITSLNYTDFFPIVRSYIESLRGDLMRFEKGHSSLNLRYLDMNKLGEDAEGRKFKEKFGGLCLMMEKRLEEFQNRVDERLKWVEGKWKRSGGNFMKGRGGVIKPAELNFHYEKIETSISSSGENTKKKKKKDKRLESRIYFNTHEDVDEFYLECLSIDNSFELNYPGVFQLLKAFDRSFWMRSMTCTTTKKGDHTIGGRGGREEDEEENIVWEESIIRQGKRGCPFTYYKERTVKKIDY